MSKLTRRQVMRTSIVAGVMLGAETTTAGSEPETASVLDLLLPKKLTRKEIHAAEEGTFTKLEFAGSHFWVGQIQLGYGVPHTLIGIYAPDKDGLFHLSLMAECWSAGNMQATVDVKTSILELRERANSKLKGQLVLSCNLRTIGTSHSIGEK